MTSQSYENDVTLHIRSHIVTCHRHTWTHPALTPARQTGTRFSYSGGTKGWVYLSPVTE